MNSKVCKYLIKCLSETVNFEQGTISKIPVISSINTNINSLVDLSKIDWDSHETSWDFNELPLISHGKISDNLEIIQLSS